MNNEKLKVKSEKLKAENCTTARLQDFLTAEPQNRKTAKLQNCKT
jgi:hypothetical protein